MPHAQFTARRDSSAVDLRGHGRYSAPAADYTEALVIGAEQSDGGDWMPLFVVLVPGHVLDEGDGRRDQGAHPGPGLPAARARRRHRGAGKQLEVPVKRLVQGAELARVVDPSVVDDASLLEDYRAIAADRR